jgi:hypothetical protein
MVASRSEHIRYTVVRIAEGWTGGSAAVAKIS